jgi:hypothetical protein
MRLIAEPLVRFVVHSLLRIPKGSYASQWSKVFGNLIMAFMDHAHGHLLAGGDLRHDWNIFIARPIATWFKETLREQAVAFGLLDAGRRSRAGTLLGYLWTGLFQCWNFLYFVEGAIRVQDAVPQDVLIEPPFGTSLILPLLRSFS